MECTSAVHDASCGHILTMDLRDHDSPRPAACFAPVRFSAGLRDGSQWRHTQHARVPKPVTERVGLRWIREHLGGEHRQRRVKRDAETVKRARHLIDRNQPFTVEDTRALALRIVQRKWIEQAGPREQDVAAGGATASSNGSAKLRRVIARSPKGSEKRAALCWSSRMASRIPRLTGCGKTGTNVTLLASTRVGPPFDVECTISLWSEGTKGLGSICTGSHCTCGCINRRMRRIGKARRFSTSSAGLSEGEGLRIRTGPSGRGWFGYR